MKIRSEQQNMHGKNDTLPGTYLMNSTEKPDNNGTGTSDCKTAVLEVEALHRIAQLISTVVHLDSTLSDILRVLHETLQMERATLVLLDETGKNLTIRASYGLSVEEEQRGVYKTQEGVVGRRHAGSSARIRLAAARSSAGTMTRLFRTPA